MSDYSLLLPLRARCQEGAEEAQTSFPPDGAGSSLPLELGRGVHEQGQVQVQGVGAGAGLAKRGGLFRNRIYEKHAIFTYGCRARSGRRRRRRAWRSGWKSLVFNISSAIYVRLIVFYSPRYVVRQVKAAVRPLLPLVHNTPLALALVLVLALLRGEQGEGLVWTEQELELKVASSSVQRAPVQAVRGALGARAVRVELEMPTWIPTMVDVEA